MAMLIGTDEAGYGPNLGPLVISVTAWSVPDEFVHSDLYAVLERVVRRVPSRGVDGVVAIADSKQLYKPGSGLQLLEHGVLTCLRTLGYRETTWRHLWSCLTSDSDSFLAACPWNAAFDAQLPCAAQAEEIDAAGQRLAAEFRATGVALRAMRSVAIFPDRWNALLQVHGKKSDVLAAETLSLLQTLVAAQDEAPVVIQCDKFGGRNRYAGLLQHVFPEHLVEVVQEGREASIYRWGPQHRRTECRFAARGESFLPTALASMVSKYLRELAMQAFNHFWRERVPGLRATAGYPTDARRFQRDIASAQQALGIEDRFVWRVR
jgi:hypothetical protein